MNEYAVYFMVLIYFVILVCSVGIFIKSIKQDKFNEDLRVKRVEAEDARKRIN